MKDLNKCPTCNRNWDKWLHNLSECVAGIGMLIMYIPIFYVIYIHSPIFAWISLIGFVILFVACIVHLYSEMRVKNYGFDVVK